MAQRAVVWAYIFALLALAGCGGRDVPVLGAWSVDAAAPVDVAGALSGQDAGPIADAAVGDVDAPALDALVGGAHGADVDGGQGVDAAEAPETAGPDIALACVPADCEDKNPCTDDACLAGTCQHTDNAAACDDGNACTYGDVCAGGGCLPAAVTNCNDGNACTDDACQPDTGCQYASLGAGTACGNGGVCDGNGSCTLNAPVGMVLIPAGTFWMGCNSAKDESCAGDEFPQHKVSLSAYYMDVSETTVAQYKACVDAGACTAPSCSVTSSFFTWDVAGQEQNPVNCVSWFQARAYCKWRGEGYDLATEAQWEMGARGTCEQNGSTAADPACKAAMRTYPWGEATPSCAYAVMASGAEDGCNGCGCGTKSTWAVGSKPAGDSPFGLHDMVGNIGEWVLDAYAFYPAGDQTDPLFTADVPVRVIRSNFPSIDPTADLRAGARSHNDPAWVLLSTGVNGIGARCARAYP